MNGVQAYRLVRRPARAEPARFDDPAQRAVLAHTDGPMLVVGGPGTGKTSTLVAAVAARIAEGTDPERVLVLTFNRRAAAERGEPSPRLLTGPEQDLIIRELLDVAGPQPGDDQPAGQPGGQVSGQPAAGQVAGQSGADQVGDQLGDLVGWPSDLRAALPTRAFASQLRDLLQRATERGIGPVELARLGERLGRADWPAAARFLRQYVAVLALRDVSNRGSVGYDHAELVRAAAGLLTDDPPLLDAERRRLSYV
jgi:superfamily I DNA/RNA helicase